MPLDHLLRVRVDSVLVRDVEPVGVRHTAGLFDERDGLVGTVEVHVREHHLGTLSGEFEGGLSADTAAPSGDDHQLVFERLAALTHFCPS
ncbi:Uncharacterised protein [Mycobacteroides abscessus subsp. massiliense]|nr:Uncharacterised protein [Mycobacteroides abscessus subsp. massiliense]